MNAGTPIAPRVAPRAAATVAAALAAIAVLPAVAVLLVGCRSEKAKVEKLVVISPHNKNIQQEFTRAFSAHHMALYGRPVEIEWRDVGGGSSKILEYLRNVYSKASTSKIDVVWGGGEDNFTKMADEGILQPMAIPEGFAAAVPETFGGQRMYDAQRRWCGSALSGFGFLYNADRLKAMKIAPPATWDDLGSPALFDLVALADPTQSGTAAATYEMIVQTARDWPAGWAKLLGILGNASRFHSAADSSADAVINEAAVATCVDFYGAMRVAKYPKTLVYVSPRGQTAFSCDPIGILKNPPHAELAQRFADFVLSGPGQALLALPAGAPDGPVQHELMRQPIRRDVYEVYRGRLSPWTTNPYEAGSEMKLDIDVRNIRQGVLKRLVQAAAIDNADGLRRAKKKLIDEKFPPQLVAEFNALPPDVSTVDGVRATAGKLHDPVQAERLAGEWQRFFRDKYERIAR